MTIAVGDHVVAQGLPGEVLAVKTVAGTTVYQVFVQQTQCRWLNSTQFVAGKTPVVGDVVLVQATPATVLEVWPGGPYPLYLLRLDQTMPVWLPAAQLNQPLPGQPPPPPPPPPPVAQPKKG